MWLYLSAVFEAFVASICSLLACEPLGSLALYACPTSSINDWYSLVWNPPSYDAPIFCNSEVVYPRWTVVFMFLMFSAMMAIIVRPVVARQLADGEGNMALYGTLYFTPTYCIINAIFGGVICAPPCRLKSYAKLPRRLCVPVRHPVRVAAVQRVRARQVARQGTFFIYIFTLC